MYRPQMTLRDVGHLAESQLQADNGRTSLTSEVWSLWETMNLFDAGRLQDVIDSLRDIGCRSEHLRELYHGDTGPNDSQFTKQARLAARNAKEIAQKSEFVDAANVASRAEAELSYPKEYAAVRSEVTHVADALCDEIKKRNFLVVSEARRHYVDNPSFLGTEITRKFPSATDDIREAGNCLGAECNTAAVFHLMRVVEWGLRALCLRLGLREVRKRKGVPIPISYAEWETMLNQLQPLVDKKISRMRRGNAKQAAQEFYYPALQDIRAIRDAWRIHLMHTRAFYSSAEAEAICAHVGRLMSALANNL